MRLGFEHKPTPKEFEMNEVVNGSANVHADQGWPNADEMQVKAVLVADVGFEFTTLPSRVTGANVLPGEGWTHTGALATQNGHSYAVWHNHTAQALIDQQVMTAAYVL
jgi:hypothetical protein